MLNFPNLTSNVKKKTEYEATSPHKNGYYLRKRDCEDVEILKFVCVIGEGIKWDYYKGKCYNSSKIKYRIILLSSNLIW